MTRRDATPPAQAGRACGRRGSGRTALSAMLATAPFAVALALGNAAVSVIAIASAIAAAPARADGDDIETEPPGAPADRPGGAGETEPVAGDEAVPAADERRDWQEGSASWYGGKFHGRLTANGEVFDEHGLTAAHRWLPLGSRIVVTNLDNGCSVTVRVTDRGPYHGNRILDCSRGVAEELGFIEKGIARIRWDMFQAPPPRRSLRLGLGPPIASSERPLIRPPRTHDRAVASAVPAPPLLLEAF